MMTGRVIRARGRLFTVETQGREYACELLKKAKQTDKVTPVAVGDLVEFTYEGDGPGGITAVQPRTSKFSRPRVGAEAKGIEQVIAANIDQMIIVVSVASPKLKQHLIDRFSIAAVKGGLKIGIVINKVDLKHKVDLQHLERLYVSVGMPVVMTSCKTGAGLDQFRDLLKDSESIMVGHSGVGKSSLLNAVQPGLTLKTQSISSSTGKGTHTTTAVELYPLEFGGYVVDTPGLKVLGLWDLKRQEVQLFFPEFEPFLGKCRFGQCSHTHEPECAIKQAVSEGQIFPERYASYTRIYKDSK